MKNNNLFNVLLNDDKVNNYTKVIIILNIMAYNNDYYIPNKKLQNIFKKYNINNDIRYIKRIINKLANNKIINIIYFGNKKYFKLNFYNKRKEIKNKEKSIIEDQYNWLNDE